jgi:hypothetical protein
MPRSPISDLGLLCAGGRYRYDAAAFGIVWPLPVAVISKRDLGWPALDPENLVPAASEPRAKCRE